MIPSFILDMTSFFTTPHDIHDEMMRPPPVTSPDMRSSMFTLTVNDARLILIENVQGKMMHMTSHVMRRAMVMLGRRYVMLSYVFVCYVWLLYVMIRS